MKLSIIIPCYNIEKYIARCINSILPQLNNETELIVVNDGSTDSSLEILEKINTEHPEIIILCQKNSGPSAARNRGAEIAKGEYIWFIDGDDYITENAINRLIQEIEKGYDVIAFNLASKLIDGKISQLVFLKNCEKDKYEFLETGQLYACSSIYKKKIFDKVKYNENLRNIEDFVYNIEITPYIEKIKNIPDILYIYDRTNENSTSMNRSKKHLVFLSNQTLEAHEYLRKKMRSIDDDKLKKRWEDILNISYIGYIFSLFQFYNCKSLKRALTYYQDLKVYPFKYYGNFKMKGFVFFLNNPFLWRFAPILKKLIIK